jgi:hypothetical protein
MARERTHDEIVDEMVWVVNWVAYYYGPGLSTDGLVALRKVLSRFNNWYCDSSWRVDIPEGEEIDFHQQFDGNNAFIYDPEEFETTRAASRGELEV